MTPSKQKWNFFLMRLPLPPSIKCTAISESNQQEPGAAAWVLTVSQFAGQSPDSHACRPRCWRTPPRCCALASLRNTSFVSKHTGGGIDLEIDSEGESQRASTQKMSRPSEASEVLRASNSQARDVRLTSKELDDCRRDMLEDGCEVLAQEQARQARLELRSPQEVFFPREGHLLALGAPPCLTFCGDEENDLAASAAREASEDTQVHVAGLEEDARLRTGALEDDIQMHLIVALEEDARVLVTGAFFGKAQSCAPAKVP
ncbi:unnamed protein product [Durusdinium trenchii]|uniref:Uncharacterized protein n=1 Tax=Durusdinium trenchii TaxID=1381693 RepID=A0ABP0NNN3_9DINO